MELPHLYRLRRQRCEWTLQREAYRTRIIRDAVILWRPQNSKDWKLFNRNCFRGLTDFSFSHHRPWYALQDGECWCRKEWSGTRVNWRVNPHFYLGSDPTHLDRRQIRSNQRPSMWTVSVKLIQRSSDKNWLKFVYQEEIRGKAWRLHNLWQQDETLLSMCIAFCIL